MKYFPVTFTFHIFSFKIKVKCMQERVGVELMGYLMVLGFPTLIIYDAVLMCILQAFPGSLDLMKLR